jgi:hypothetical protein
MWLKAEAWDSKKARRTKESKDFQVLPVLALFAIPSLCFLNALISPK